MRKKIIYLLICFIFLIPCAVFATETEKNVELEKKLELNTNYQYNKNSNTVTVKITSKTPFKPTKINWELSKDKKTYTYQFKENTTYKTTFEDINGTTSNVEIKVTQIDEKGPILKISYEYKKETKSVVAKVMSDEILGATKINWKLSQDKKTYTYEFKENTTYTTTFEDIYGNSSKIEIKVTQIKGPELKINYEYKKQTNSVIAKVVSDEQMGATKVNWNLSQDKKTYTYEFKENTKYTTSFEDRFGNSSKIEINITQIDEKGPSLKISYEYKKETKSVVAKVVSDEQMGATKVNWKLSQDKKTYTYEFKENTKYTTTFEDIYGNSTKIEININQIDVIAPKITSEYILNEDNTVTVKLVSNEPLATTKVNWTLSEDKKTYTYTFKENTDYATTFEDLAGNETVVKIKIKLKQYEYKGTPNIKVSYMYTAKETVTTRITSDVKFKDTKINWVLSKDGYSYTYVFKENSIYKTEFQDINNNKIKVDILVNFFETKSRYNGIDVSAYQKHIDWAKVKNDGIDFAIIRAGFRGYGSSGSMNLDLYFEQNLKNAALNGIDIGIYFYSQAITVQEAIEEADFVLNLLKKYNIEIKYPIAIDTEKTPDGTGRADWISKTLRTDICKAFCDRIEKAGYKSMIYSNKNWLLENLELDRLNDYDIWVAQYADETDYPYAYTIWQYTSSGTVNGIEGRVDMNYCYKKY